MLKCVEGVYRKGKIELAEKPSGIDEARVIVTFLPAGESVDLARLGVTEAEAAALRWRLGSIAEDWDRPAMAVCGDL